MVCISSSFWLECKYQHWQQKSPVYKICLSLFHIFELVNKKFPIFRLVCKYNVSNVLDLMFLSQTCWNNAPNVSHLEKFVFTNIECAGWLNKMAKMHEIYSDFKPNASNFLSYPSPNWNYWDTQGPDDRDCENPLWPPSVAHNEPDCHHVLAILSP